MSNQSKKISKNLRLDENVISMIETISEKENRSFVNAIETCVREYYKTNYNTEWRAGTITIGKDYKNYKVLMKEQFEIEEYGACINVLAIIADEDFKLNEFSYKKGDIIYDSESKDENLNNINKTVLVYQYIQED
ncbi:MAG: hypothetical protein PHP92_05210 [Candidatus Nanoarchaeia archaeon]|nr:hypothetical protein [Candidatus Nanoarchaeia archaeon]